MITIKDSNMSKKYRNAISERNAEIESFVKKHDPSAPFAALATRPIKGNGMFIMGASGDLDHGISPWDFTYPAEMGWA